MGLITYKPVFTRKSNFGFSLIFDKCPSLSIGDVIIKIDESYFRPLEVETLLGDPTKAKKVLGWKPQVSAQEMCAEMVASDLKLSRKRAMLLENGYSS